MSSGQRLSTAPAGGPLRLTTKSKTVSTMGPSGDYSQAMPRHRRTVQDVMTTAVVAADRLTPYKEIVLLLAEHRISGLPVLADGWQVIGVVSEADLLARRPEGLTAGELMTSPPITVGPDAAIPAVVQAMNRYHVRRLPVTGADRQLIGLVSRRDVLRVFLRPDWDIAADVSRVLGEILTLPAAVDAADLGHRRSGRRRDHRDLGRPIRHRPGGLRSREPVTCGRDVGRGGGGRLQVTAKQAGRSPPGRS
jgi:CBS domain-containing protein